MSFIVYFFVALIAAASVLFGLNWGPAPMSPMPPSKYELRAAVPPPPPAPVVAEAKPDAKPEAAAKPEAKPAGAPAAAPAARPATAPTAVASTAAAPNAVTPNSVASSPVAQAPAPLNAADQPASIVAAEPAAGAPDVAAPAAPKCNIEVCANFYRSFTAADCTYQPSDGPRRLCTKGAPPPTTAAPATPTTPATSSTTTSGTAVPEARAQACNIAACSQSYPRSFSAADCTFQPAEGPRRACTK